MGDATERHRARGQSRESQWARFGERTKKRKARKARTGRRERQRAGGTKSACVMACDVTCPQSLATSATLIFSSASE